MLDAGIWERAVVAALGVMALALGWAAWRWRGAERARARAERGRLATWAAARDALLLIDADGRVREANDAAQALAGADAVATGTAFADRLSPESRGAWTAALATALREGRSEVVTATVVPSAGGGREVEASVVRVAPGPGATAVAVLRPRVAAPRPVAPAPADRDAVVQEAHGLAHEFNNLLTTIGGRLELAERRVPPGGDAAADINEARHAVARAAALSRRLLDLSASQALTPRVVDVNFFLADLEPALREGPAGPTGVVLSLAPDAGSVNADPARLQDVVRGLVQRARRAGGLGTHISVRTARIARPPGLSPSHPAEWVAIEVTDDAPTSLGGSPHGGGPMGAEVASAHAFVRQSGGVVDTFGAGARGTTVRLSFPRIAGEALPMPPGRLNEGGRGRQPTVLIVEDEESVRSFVRIVLEREGFQVLQATHGVEALTMLDDPRVTTDVLLTDVMMPQMGGRELAERVLAVQPDVRVVFMSGYVSDKALLTGVAERQAAFLQKPFAIEDLVRVVRTAAVSG